jgi:tetratricopeptide (TPR) repeat protein
MHTASCLLSLFCLLGALPAQQDPPRPAVVVTQQEQNALRAAAFKAEVEGRFGDAATAFQELYDAAPTRLDWCIATARCLGRSGQFGAAMDLLEVARKRFEGDLEIEAMLARTLILQTESKDGIVHPEILWADAAEIAAGVLKTHPDHEDSRLLLAQARYLLGEWEEAARQAEEAVKRHPKRPGAHVLLGRISTDKCRQLLARYKAQAPTGQAQSDMVAKIHHQRTRAKSAFQRAAALDPTRAHPHVALSQLAAMDGKDAEAKEHLRDALAIDPDTRVDHALLTAGLDWRARLEFYRRIQERFQDTTKLPENLRAPRIGSLQFQIGRAQLDGLQFEPARASFREAIANNPGAKNAYYYCFLAAYYLDDYDEAEQQAAEYARASAPGFADVLRALDPQQRVQIADMVRYLGDRAYQQKRIGNSRDLNHVTACLKDSADAWNNHAFLCRETQQYQRAYESYQHAIEKEPASPQLWNDAAVVLHYHQPTEANLLKAQKMYRKAIDLATKVLADRDASEATRQYAQEAQANARANLLEIESKKRPVQKPPAK